IGKVFIDNFRYEPIDDSVALSARPSFDASSMKKGGEPVLDLTETVLTNWKSSGMNPGEWLSIDFGYQKEIGGMVIDWEGENYATAYDILITEDGKEWTNAYSVTKGNGGRDYVYLPESQGKTIKLALSKSRSGKGFSISRLIVKGPEFGATANDFFASVAKEQSRGLFPKYFLPEQCYWTIVGSPGDVSEALINEAGTIEVDQLSFSIEPFLYINNRLVTWNDVTLKQSLENDYLPIPTVEWKYNNLTLAVRAFSAGPAGKSMLMATYTIINSGGSGKGKLFLALRPFQVNPPWQGLNHPGGVSRIDSARMDGGMLLVNEKNVIPLNRPSGFGATSFENGDITEYLAEGQLPSDQSVLDGKGFCSAALAYDFDVPGGAEKEIHVVVPFHAWSGSPTSNMNDESANMYVSLAHAATRQMWETMLDRFQVKLPLSAQPIINTVKSNLAYIFINQDGPRIQPGSRNYERSWIRDGSLTSTALLQLGIKDEVREYADWYAKFQFPSGKIPCVVDSRGGDPTNEHDSHGQMIYLIMQTFHFIRDTSWLRTRWETVVKAVRYMQSLRAERKTEVYKNGTPEQRACYGLVPESISHEGYWNKPMHSYWDDFFVLRGLKDATAIAGILGEKKLEAEFAAERDDFRKDLYASIQLAMNNKHVNYIPGCVELGDFDATSTTIGINPANELGKIPEPALHNTFDRYYDYFTKRKNNTIAWKDYTPYENRVIGSFVYLDQKERAYDAVNFFMNDRRPHGWNHWAEVVHRDPLTPKYIGDMPHTWCGSDFIRSVRAMFVYERESDTSLVIGAGIADAWVNDSLGVRVTNLSTYYGTISYSMRNTGKAVVVQLDGSVRVPSGKIVLKSPLSKRIKSVLINGRKSRFAATEIPVRTLPSRVEITY
ncbi:MAG: putative secreted protein, partial [Bacteroidetes bacterium]|nr:putative secreted protein [Bacteroidota bacterium]